MNQDTNTIKWYRQRAFLHRSSKQVRTKVKRIIKREFLRLHPQLSRREAMYQYRAEWHAYPA